MGEAEGMRDIGLSSEELNYRNKQSELAYAYNVKNIARGAGGSAGTYLGNVQSAAAGLYNDYGKTAAIDEETRRRNRSNFQQMAGKDEGINRQIFEDDLSQVMMNKKQGAALVGDAINNIRERKQFKDKYGKDSAFSRYKESLRKDSEYNRLSREKADRTTSRSGINEQQFKYDYAQQMADTHGQSTESPLGFNEDKIQENLAKSNDVSTSDTPIPSGGGAGTNLANSVTDPNSADYGSNIEIGATTDENVGSRTFKGKSGLSPEPKKTSTDIPSDKSSNTEAKANIKKNIEKAKPKKLREELKTLREAAQYGGLTNAQKERIKEIKGLL
jgi:hypothetical protein